MQYTILPETKYNPKTGKFETVVFAGDHFAKSISSDDANDSRLSAVKYAMSLAIIETEQMMDGNIK